MLIVYCYKLCYLMITYRVAAINPEFFSSYFQMTQHSWKSSDLFELKANLLRYILRIILFIKIAVSFNNSLDPGPQALEGLHHGVPVEGPQQLLHLLDQIFAFVARLFNDPYFRFAAHKIEKKVKIRQVMRPNLLLLYTSATYRMASMSQSCALLLS